MRCPTMKELAGGLERGDWGPTINAHFSECSSCRDIVEGLRRESESLTLSIADLWVAERISCPHRDVILAHEAGSLDSEQASYVDFHINVLGCPACQSTSAECEDALDQKTPERLRRATEKSLNSTAIFFKNLRRS